MVYDFFSQAGRGSGRETKKKNNDKMTKKETAREDSGFVYTECLSKGIDGLECNGKATKPPPHPQPLTNIKHSLHMIIYRNENIEC